VLIFTIMLTHYVVVSQSCLKTTLRWATHSMAWRISYDPIKNSETIVPLPSLSQTSEYYEAGCDYDKVVFQCQGC
jgi:hypothetical protein